MFRRQGLLVALFSLLVLFAAVRQLPSTTTSTGHIPNSQVAEVLLRARYMPSRSSERMESVLQLAAPLWGSRSRITLHNAAHRIYSQLWTNVLHITAIFQPTYYRHDSDGFSILSLLDSCGPSPESSTGLIQSDFIIPPEVLKKPAVGSYCVARKIDTALMCRALPEAPPTQPMMRCPRTFLASPVHGDEIAQFLQHEQASPGARWLYKPDRASGGKGIVLGSATEVAVAARQSFNESDLVWQVFGIGGVIQQVLENPLRIDGRRFSIRMYVVVTAMAPVTGFYSSGGYGVLLASRDDDAPNMEASLISNVHYQNGNNGRTQLVLLEHLVATGRLERWQQHTLPAIGNGLAGFLKQQDIPEQPQGRFQFLGCDFLIDGDLEPWFLECNRCAGLNGVPIRNTLPIFQELLYIVLHQAHQPVPESDLDYWTMFK